MSERVAGIIIDAPPRMPRIATVAEPYDGICEECGKIYGRTMKEFCDKCDGIIVDFRRLKNCE